MTAQEKIRVLVAKRMQKAGAAARAARTLLYEDLPEDSINRSYFAMFQAASALLLLKGLGTSKHKGVISLFDLHFIRSGLLPRELSRWIHAAFEARQEADYGEELLDSRLLAESTLSNAERFLTQATSLADRLLAESDASP